MTRVVLPYHLRNLAHVDGEVLVQAATIAEVLDAVEQAYPVLRGTMRDPRTGVRRPFVRFYACEEDLSHDPPTTALPEPVRAEREPFCVVGAMAGG